MGRFLNWLDHRTGYRHYMREALYENIPGGSRWRYVWGSTLVFTFAMQVITGLFLWTAYSPSAQTAWESVYYIQYEMQLGWLLRGLHHFTAHAMVVLLVLHLMQVVIDGAYKAPREVNFWLGLILMLLILSLSLTGYLLPWDQKGYWATGVATNLMGLVPVVGQEIQRVVVGGDAYGHHTLTRFFALHAGIIPALIVVVLVVHLALFRRHKLTHKIPLRAADQYFWPDQILKDAVACLAVLAVVLFLVTWHQFSGDHTGKPPGDYLGAELGPPADPAHEYKARPEWYFLFLFQFLKLFEGYGATGEVVGAIILPGLLLVILFLMPLVGRWRLGHGFNVGFMLCLLLGMGLLTAQAIKDDYYARAIDDSKFAGDDAKIKEHFGGDEARIKAYKDSKEYLAGLELAEKNARRAKQLAASRTRIPVEGAAWLLRNDPRKLFEENCATCHTYVNEKGEGIKLDNPTAPNLHGFASRAWVRRFLSAEHIASPEFFGNTAHAEGNMVAFVQADWAELDDESRENIVLALSAQAQLPSQAKQDKQDAEKIAAGLSLMVDEGLCISCHKLKEGESDGSTPDLTGYGSREWLTSFISNAAAPRFYGPNNDRMPAFCRSPLFAEENTLTPRQIGFLVDWLRGEWLADAKLDE